jgi:hypothetical protein
MPRRAFIRAPVSSRGIDPKGKSDAILPDEALEVNVGAIRTSVVELVRCVCAPLPEKFEFMKFGDAVYEGIIQSFIDGAAM